MPEEKHLIGHAGNLHPIGHQLSNGFAAPGPGPHHAGEAIIQPLWRRGSLVFHFALGPANYVASSTAQVQSVGSYGSKICSRPF